MCGCVQVPIVDGRNLAWMVENLPRVEKLTVHWCRISSIQDVYNCYQSSRLLTEIGSWVKEHGKQENPLKTSKRNGTNMGTVSETNGVLVCLAYHRTTWWKFQLSLMTVIRNLQCIVQCTHIPTKTVDSPTSVHSYLDSNLGCMPIQVYSVYSFEICVECIYKYIYMYIYIYNIFVYK